MITIENKGNEIHIFGRNAEGELYHKKDRSFRPYFYYEDKNGSFKSIYGNKLSKKMCNDPKEVTKLRVNYKHYEADITYTSRYLIDKIDKIPKQPLRCWYLDIETKAEGIDIESANNPIYSICIYDSFDKLYNSFTEENEKELLQSFIAFLREKNPDILIAWNGDGFDFPYLFKRIEQNNLDVNKLSRDGESYMRNKNEVRIFGRVLLDLMRAYKKITSGGRESWSLDYIAKYEKVGEKEKYEGSLDDLYKNNKQKFLIYNKKDVELLKLLDEKLKMVDFFDNIRRYAKCKFEDVYQNSKIIDQLILEFCKNKVILPSKNRLGNEEPFEGAYVVEPKPGLFKSICLADVKSLYPSLMVSFNISTEKYLEKKEKDCINIDNKFYYSKEPGILPEIIKNMFSQREEYKKEMKKYNKNQEQYWSYYALQDCVKRIMNSIYGVLGYEGFRLYKKEVARTVTYLGESVLKFSIDYLNKNGAEVVYGDTDSVFFKSNIKEGQELVEKLNKEYKKFVEKFNIESHILNMEFSKGYKTIIFVNKMTEDKGAKKKYAGRLIWDDGKTMDYLDITGFETKRSDSPQVVRDFQKELLLKILYEEPKEIIDKFIAEFRDKFKGFKEELGIPMGVGKSLSKYETEPIHIRAVKLSNSRHKTNFGTGQKIKYIYVSSNPPQFKFENVIAFLDKIPPGYKIDYKKMEERLLDTKINILYSALGWKETKNNGRNLLDYGK